MKKVLISKSFSKYLEKSSKYLEVSRIFALKISRFFNHLAQNFPQREVKSTSGIVYTSIMEIKQLSKQHGCKV